MDEWHIHLTQMPASAVLVVPCPSEFGSRHAPQASCLSAASARRQLHTLIHLHNPHSYSFVCSNCAAYISSPVVVVALQRRGEGLECVPAQKCGVQRGAGSGPTSHRRDRWQWVKMGSHDGGIAVRCGDW